MLSIANLQLFELFEQVCMSVSYMFRQVGLVGSFGHSGFKASFTDRLYGVRGLALTVSNISEMLHAPASSTSRGRSAEALRPLSAVSVSLCSVTVRHCETTTATLAAGSEEAERSCTQTRCPHCHTKFIKY